jgi:hypothetical protein
VAFNDGHYVGGVIKVSKGSTRSRFHHHQGDLTTDGIRRSNSSICTTDTAVLEPGTLLDGAQSVRRRSHGHGNTSLISAARLITGMVRASRQTRSPSMRNAYAGDRLDDAIKQTFAKAAPS